MTDGGIELERLHTNQRLLVKELLARGAQVQAIDYDLELLEVVLGGVRRLLLDRSTDRTAYLPSVLASDKHQTKQMLRAGGIRVPNGECFPAQQFTEAMNYADTLGFPVVIKPNTGSHGDMVYSGLNNTDQMEAALHAFLHASGGQSLLLVEQHVSGAEHRVFMTVKGDYAVLRRDPARVIGDGLHTLHELVEIENARRLHIRSLGDSALCPLTLDAVALAYLRRCGCSIQSIPAAGEIVPLRLSSNLAQGGTSHDMTDQAHDSVLKIARRVLKIFDGLPCIGIDVIAQDITAPIDQQYYAVLEVNANPGLAMHHFPVYGTARNVAAMLADAVF